MEKTMSERKFIPLNDLKRHNEQLRDVLQRTLTRVLDSGWFILGPEVKAFENEFAAYCGATHCVGLANGTDALEIGLRALGLGPGDEIATVANAGMYSTTAIRAIGATPVYAEIDPTTLLLDLDVLGGAITPRTRAVIATHLYGRMVDMKALLEIAHRHSLAVIEDCAQAHGAQLQGRRAGSWGDIGCFSFYPTKNLGALGDGGAVVTSDGQVADRVRRLRQYGWTSKYLSAVSGGQNSRLDEIQAAVLRVKLHHLDEWNEARRAVASRYATALSGLELGLPPGAAGEMIYHLYVIRSARRDDLKAALRKRGIGCDVHYPIPDYLQPSCADLGYGRGYLPLTERACNTVLSIPCFAELADSEIDRVAQSLDEIMHEEKI